MSVSKRTLAYDYLRDQIVFCKMKPGDLIDEKAVSAQLGFSRTPVREAINKLAEEGLVQVFPRKGIIVSQLSLKDLNDMLDSRMLVEPYLMHQAFAHLDAQTLRSYRAAANTRLERGSVKPVSIQDDFDYTFHMYFARQAGNKYLLAFMSTLLALSQRTRVFLPYQEGRDEASCQEHIAIIDAALNGDEENAVEAIRAHLHNSRISYLQASRVHADYFS
ncbi:MAG: GntR family transcriptional regulator [Bifidobacteriales bacterium]|nr:GntR family transcriptional regulator [Bifidobacteriales bacterium]